MSLQELIKRCTEANGADRELDAAIWLTVTPGATRSKGGYTHAATGRWCDIDETRDPTGRLIVVPAYTSSFDAAASLAEDRAFSVGMNVHHRHFVAIINILDGDGCPISIGTASAPSGPLALCVAALSARLELSK